MKSLIVLILFFVLSVASKDPSSAENAVQKSKEFQWRHTIQAYTSKGRKRWLQEYRDHLDKSLREIQREERLLKKDGFRVGDSWEEQDYEKYRLFDTPDGFFGSRHTVLATREKLKSLDTSEDAKKKKDPETLTIKSNFPDEALADSMRVVHPLDDIKVKRKTEQDIYPCYSKFGHSIKMIIPKGIRADQALSLREFVNDPSEWLDNTLPVADSSSLDLEPSSILPQSSLTSKFEIEPTGDAHYRYFAEVPIQIGSFSTAATVYSQHGSLSEALTNANASVLESSIRIILGIPFRFFSNCLDKF